MSRSHSAMRRGAVVGLAFASSLAAAPAASAESRTLDAACRFPGVGNTQVRVTYDLKTSVNVYDRAPVYTITSVRFTAPVFDWGSKATGTGVFTASLQQGDLSISQNASFAYPTVTPTNGPAARIGEPGEWKFIAQDLSLNLTVFDANGNIVRFPGLPEEDSDGNPDTTDFPCTLPVGGTAPTVVASDGSNQGPTTPGPIQVVTGTPGSANISWGASIDDKGISGYEIFLDDAKVATVPATQLTYQFTGLAESMLYEVRVRAIDTDGLISQPATATFQTGHYDRIGYPTNVQAEATATAIALRWNITGGPFSPQLYRVFVDGKAVKDVEEQRAELDGLTPGKTYVIQVAGVTGVSESGRSEPIEVTLPGQQEEAGDFITAGTATIKTLVAGKVSLRGGLRVSADASGAVSGDFALNPASARLTALGFLPVTAKLAFATSGSLTGSYTGDTLATNAKVRIKVVEAKLFGAIPLVAGSNCQTRQLTDLTLTSPGFSFQTGGTLTGKFAISDLNGCGVLNGLVSPATAGTGNTITLKATNTPPPVGVS